jgi:hypothetical protein
MAGKLSKWLMGCGIGCAVVLILVIGFCAVGVRFMSQQFKEVGAAARSQGELLEKYGETESFVPRPDGSIPADRMEVFLSVRENLQEPQGEVEALVADFPPDELLREEKSFRKLFKVLQSIVDLMKPIMGYVDARNDALLEAEMGLGEYVYIYSLAYHSWLGRPLEDGPVFRRQVEGVRAGEKILSKGDSPFSPDQVRRRYRRYMLSILRNQLDALPPGAEEEWRNRLREEIGRFEGNPGRVAWKDGLPAAIESSLAPYRDRLEDVYHAATNPFEMPMRENEGRGGANWSVRID